jgi:GNAT superfamily N-acetyltransferase
MNSDVSIRATFGAEQLDAVRQLRYRVLREPIGLPFEATLFVGDELETTRHLIAMMDSHPIACLTLLLPASKQEPPSLQPVQLRGMAVLPSAQGKGVGSRLLAAVHTMASESGWSLWCNARQSAVPFYRGNGWRIDGPAFDIPPIGPHFQMRWEPCR